MGMEMRVKMRMGQEWGQECAGDRNRAEDDGD